MKPYKEIINYSPEQFLRITGISQKNLLDLSSKVALYIELQKKRNPLKRRGLKSYKLSLQDCVLLTLYYIRHYPTFQILGSIFDINESYCHKIYNRYMRIIAQVEKLPGRLDLIDNKRDVLVIDVSEQPIERPVKDQKNITQVRKNGIQLKLK